jgi:Fe2+ or Zn2+ uptake regulation protein
MSRNRKTRQREVISLIVEQTRRPLTAKEIFLAGRLDVPTLGLRTVYRQIGRLVDYQAPPGFSIDGTEIVFYGICPDCSK